MTTLRPSYALAAGLALVTEIGIARYVDDDLIRPYGGDSLAVVLVYLALRAVLPLRVRAALAIALTVAVIVELGQWAQLLDVLGLRDNVLARTLLGGQFDLLDFVAYGSGAAVVLAVEAMRARPSTRGPVRG